VGKSTNQQGTDIRTIFADIFIKNIQLNNNLPPIGTLATRMDQLLLQRSWRPGAVHVA